MAKQPAGIDKTSLNVFGFKPRVAFKNGFRAVSCGQHLKDMLNGKPPPSYDRFPAEYPGVYRDPF